jgi:hypothetical protein
MPAKSKNPRLDPRLLELQPQKKTTSEAQLRAARNWWRRHAAETIRRGRGRGAHREDQLFTTSAPDKPWLRWLDQHGNLHIEKEISAEELIRRWNAKEESKCRKRKQPRET